jgi:predicted phage-related endonuclease
MPKAIPTVSQFDNLPVGELVDQLGSVKAEITDLETREKSLRAELLKRCVIEAEGAQYAAAVTQAIRWTLDTKSVRSEMGDVWFDRRCRQSLVTTVTVAARTASQKLAA